MPEPGLPLPLHGLALMHSMHSSNLSVQRNHVDWWQTLKKGMGSAPTLCALGIRGAPCTILWTGLFMVAVRCMTQGCLLHAMLELL